MGDFEGQSFTPPGFPIFPTPTSIDKEISRNPPSVGLYDQLTEFFSRPTTKMIAMIAVILLVSWFLSMPGIGL